MNRGYDVCFIVGAARSGTTWTQLLLAEFPGVAAVRETHLVPKYLSPLWQAWLKEKTANSPVGLRFSLRDPEFMSGMRAFVGTIFDAIHSRNQDARILVEKTPRHVLDLDLLQDLLPGAYFIHVVRDPRAVVASQLAVQREPWSFLSGSENCETMAIEWKRRVRLAVEATSKSPRQLINVRFEDLKADLAAEMERLLTFLNMRCSPAVRERVLSRASKIDAAYLDKRRKQAPRDSVAYEERERFFRRGEIDSWKEELARDQIRRIQQICEAEMRLFGYTRV